MARPKKNKADAVLDLLEKRETSLLAELARVQAAIDAYRGAKERASSSSSSSTKKSKKQKKAKKGSKAAKPPKEGTVLGRIAALIAKAGKPLKTAEIQAGVKGTTAATISNALAQAGRKGQLKNVKRGVWTLPK